MLIIFGSERVLFEVLVDRCSDGNETVESKIMIEKVPAVSSSYHMCLLLPRALVSVHAICRGAASFHLWIL